MESINRYIDHTLLKATATKEEVVALCAEAHKYQFYAVCVNSCRVAEAAATLKETPVKVASVIGFPLGAMTRRAKVAEAVEAVSEGADEIDMVINIGWTLNNDFERVAAEIGVIKEAIGTVPLKVILEMCYLTGEQKRKACQAVISAGGDFIKTSTGFGSGGATPGDIRLIREEIEAAGAEGRVRIKAAGGIKNRDVALAYINAGVSRLGTSSGIALMDGQSSNSDY